MKIFGIYLSPKVIALIGVIAGIITAYGIVFA